jgi:drug/metabolite transporter (DMT)-like permease
MNEIGRKTFFWYRVYCAAMAALYFGLTIMGLVLAVMQPDTREYEREEVLIMGIIYAIVGMVFFVVYAVALFLPPRPYNWVVGFVMMAIGMTSCCFIPAVIPLLIFWIKPETQQFFGRK